MESFTWTDVTEWMADTFSNIDVSPSAIIDAIWPESENADGKEVISDIIYRSIDASDTQNINPGDYDAVDYSGSPGEGMGGGYGASPNLGFGYFTDSYGRQYWIMSAEED